MVDSKRGLYRLFYRSRQTDAVAAELDQVVLQIIQSSIRNNREAGLTGLLLTLQGYFVQALEGEVDAVRGAYARITLDPRHGDPHIISQGHVEARLFPDWNMCARALAPSDAAILDMLDSKGQFGVRTLTPARVERLLVTIAEIQRRTSLVAVG
jgi:hypothetical protein